MFVRTSIETPGERPHACGRHHGWRGEAAPSRRRLRAYITRAPLISRPGMCVAARRGVVCADLPRRGVAWSGRHPFFPTPRLAPLVRVWGIRAHGFFGRATSAAVSSLSRVEPRLPSPAEFQGWFPAIATRCPERGGAVASHCAARVNPDRARRLFPTARFWTGRGSRAPPREAPKCLPGN